jgi:hypothetical protein
MALWIVIEPNNKKFSNEISKKRNMFLAERFQSHILDKHGKHHVSTYMIIIGIRNYNGF